jgi:hypothetical protein
MSWLVPLTSPTESVQVTTKPSPANAATCGSVSAAALQAPVTVVGETTFAPVFVLIVKKESKPVGYQGTGSRKRLQNCGS